MSDPEPQQRLKAWLVLDDAKAGIMRWSYGPINGGSDSRVVYAGTIALLRAVGHVLDKVDTKRFPQISNEVRLRFKRWKLGQGADVIFAEFVERERNLLLKEYAPTWDEKNSVQLNWMRRTVREGRSASSKALQDALNEKLAGKTTTVILMPDGPLAGYSFDELLFEAWRWWSEELMEIEALLGEES